MKYLLYFLLSCCFSVSIQAQVRSDRYKPKWLTQQVPAQNNAYLFERAFGDGVSLNEARQNCFINLMNKLEHERGIVVSSKVKYSSHISRDSYSKTKDFSMECVENGKAITLTCRAIDEFWQKENRYGCSILYSIANMAYPDRLGDNISVTAHYGARGLWRSAIIPGWGQFHKGANLKGGLILGGCAALAAGIVFTENQRSDYIRKIGQTHDVNQIKNYSTKADHFATARNICIGAAAALYLYNLIDAVAAPGARRIVVHRRSAAGQTYSFAPTVMLDGTTGMVAAITF